MEKEGTAEGGGGDNGLAGKVRLDVGGIGEVATGEVGTGDVTIGELVLGEG